MLFFLIILVHSSNEQKPIEKEKADDNASENFIVQSKLNT